MRTARLAGVEITAPCPWCVRAWFPRSGGELVIPQASFLASLPRAQLIDPDGSPAHAPFFPHPECLRHPPLRPGPKDAGETEERLEALGVASGFTPVKALFESDVPQGAPTVAIAYVDPPSSRPGHRTLTGRGVDLDSRLARRKAIVEAIERFSLFLPPRARLHWARPEKLGASIPELPFGLPPEQRWWCEATRLSDGAPRFVPLETVVHRYVCKVERPLAAADSTGMAAHLTRDAAVTAGLLEAHERAGVSQLWAARAPPRWERSSWPPAADALARTCEALGYEAVVLAHQPFQGTLVCFCLLLRMSRERGPALVAGCGAAFTPEDALVKALLEAYAQLIHGLEVFDDPPAPEGSDDPYSRFLFYFDRTRRDGMLRDWQVREGPALPFPSLPAASSRPPPESLAVDRGNVLTDDLGLSVVQVLLPSHPAWDAGSGPSGWPLPQA